MEATCATCGKQFTPDKPGRKYCGRACYYASQQGHKPYNAIEPEERACLVCGRVFLVGGRGRPKRVQVYCSSRCQGRSQFTSNSTVRGLSDTEAAYIAGLIDGEGSIMLYARMKGAGLRVTVSNTYRPIIDWLLQTTEAGSAIEAPRKSSNHKVGWTWQLNAEAADSLLRQISKYLVIKRRQADLALEFRNKIQDSQWRRRFDWQQEMLQQMQQLNRRGPDMTASAGG